MARGQYAVGKKLYEQLELAAKGWASRLPLKQLIYRDGWGRK